ncbi:hypothetical protein BD410DRAFT_848954 [Rickenella mellea]|uniref:Mediator of RNA polymerase II transcription subunit 17 n=1 Tax=Rickenella mellea TaxID=50990 RepID=A0A4R5XER5_9AGAM|nr:hypothetical protein BD410DRAFT_848954 [Rickenella mellea]
MQEPEWKTLKLPLERPYKDDQGEHIPDLIDITQDGQQIYEPRQDWSAKLGNKFRKIFVERGHDFFDRSDRGILDSNAPPNESIAGNEKGVHEPDELVNVDDNGQKFMSPEMLFKMRMEIIPRLHVAQGEMSHARDLLSVLLSSSTPSQPPTLPAASLTSTIVTKPPPVVSVQAFEAQLLTGEKDDALRKASNILKTAAASLERGSKNSEKYWSDALKIRKVNWGLIPAPLPLGSAFGKGADKTSKDFLISYGLEESSQMMRKRAIGHMANWSAESNPLAITFPMQQKTRLRVLLSWNDDGKERKTFTNKIKYEQESSLDDTIRAAQRQVVEQEIFSELLKEAGNLSTASARLSERLIVIEAAQGLDLQFELVDAEVLEDESSTEVNDVGGAMCDLIFSTLHILLLRSHNQMKSFRLGSTGSSRQSGTLRVLSTPVILQPIIDLLQYRVFCDRIKAELSRMVDALSNTHISATLRFEPIGESGEQLVKSMVNDVKTMASGEAVLRIDHRQAIRFTFVAPSTLVANLPQATIPVASIPQLSQLLVDEIERGLLGRICEIGTELCEVFNGVWFVDEMMCRAVGRWEGCILSVTDYFVIGVSRLIEHHS